MTEFRRKPDGFLRFSISAAGLPAVISPLAFDRGSPYNKEPKNCPAVPEA